MRISSRQYVLPPSVCPSPSHWDREEHTTDNHGLYLDLRIGTVNKRTSIGKAHTALLGHLRQFVGESTVITELLLSRIVFKALKLYLFESEELSKPLSEMLPVYLSMSNSLRRDLAELNRLAVAPKEQDLMSYLKENYELKHHKDVRR